MNTENSPNRLWESEKSLVSFLRETNDDENNDDSENEAGDIINEREKRQGYLLRENDEKNSKKDNDVDKNQSAYDKDNDRTTPNEQQGKRHRRQIQRYDEKGRTVIGPSGSSLDVGEGVERTANDCKSLEGNITKLRVFLTIFFTISGLTNLLLLFAWMRSNVIAVGDGSGSVNDRTRTILNRRQNEFARCQKLLCFLNIFLPLILTTLYLDAPASGARTN